MALERRIGTKVAKNLRREDASATRVDPYTYVGIVKNNVDPTRCGRLQVWIPDVGGEEDEPKNWRTVSYASPYMGVTNIPKASQTNAWNTVAHTYGMWMVPPDIGVEVLVLFVGGDPLQGYWFACVNSNLSRYMLPGMASASYMDDTNASAEMKAAKVPGVLYPVTEFNENLAGNYKAAFLSNPKPIHEEQARVLRNQGLDRDDIRGAVSSSSQRETPSNVFGISTPGRPLKDPADDPEFLKKVKDGTMTADDYAVTTRKGGHQFVMDDGAADGRDQLVRLRTARGHQIMMHDSTNTLYISNADGSIWIEMGPGANGSGRLDIYSQGSINLRTENSINFHADKDFNINVGGNFHVRSGKKTQIDCNKFVTKSATDFVVGTEGKTTFKVGSEFSVDNATKMSLLAGSGIFLNAPVIRQNSGGAVKLKQPASIKTYLLPDTKFDTVTGLYKVQPKLLDTIVTLATTHEPHYLRPSQHSAAYYVDLAAAAAKSAASVGPAAPAAGPTLAASFKGTVDATKASTGTGVTSQVSDNDIRNQPAVVAPVGSFSNEQTTAYLAQVGKSQSGEQEDQYSYNNPDTGNIGKYQLDYSTLKDLGYVKDSVTDNAQLTNPNSWTGKDGLESIDGFYAAPSVQESIATEYTQRNYNALVDAKIITKADSPEVVGGILSVAHVIGPDDTISWRQGQAATGYQAAWDRAQQAYANAFGRNQQKFQNLQSMAVNGQSAAGAQGQAALSVGQGMAGASQNYGNNMSSLALAQGQNQANMYTGLANTLGSTLMAAAGARGSGNLGGITNGLSGGNASNLVRSEEHTSELQSH